jgi:hypothetical protein
MAGRSISITLVFATLVLTAAHHAGGQHHSSLAPAGARDLVSSTRTRFPVSADPLTIRRSSGRAGCLAAGNLVVQRQYTGRPFTVRPQPHGHRRPGAAHQTCRAVRV